MINNKVLGEILNHSYILKVERVDNNIIITDIYNTIKFNAYELAYVCYDWLNTEYTDGDVLIVDDGISFTYDLYAEGRITTKKNFNKYNYIENVFNACNWLYEYERGKDAEYDKY